MLCALASHLGKQSQCIYETRASLSGKLPAELQFIVELGSCLLLSAGALLAMLFAMMLLACLLACLPVSSADSHGGF